MEWVETTARTIEEAQELALDQLGSWCRRSRVRDRGEPKQGLFGRLRGEARVRARVRPAPCDPSRTAGAASGRRPRRRGADGDHGRGPAPPADRPTDEAPPSASRPARRRPAGNGDRAAALGGAAAARPPPTRPDSTEGSAMSTDDRPIDPTTDG